MWKAGGTRQSDPRRVGGAAARFVLAERGWTSRHVEHVEVLDEVFARRRLTVDLTLPPVRGGSVCDLGEGEELFVMPVALMRKDRPVTDIDLVDEEGRSLPLLTRAENAAITAEALIAAARLMVRPFRLGDDLADRLRRVALADPDTADEAYREAPTTSAAQARARRLAQHSSFERFDTFALRAIAHSVIWVALRGRRGDRRIVKLVYEEPVNERARQRRTRLALRFGLESLDVWLFTPHIPDAGSYHLSVSNPAGLDLRRLELLAALVPREGERFDYYVERAVRGGHIYVAGARAVGEGAVAMSLRVTRRGFVTQSLLAAALITALLVVFAACSTALATKQPEVAGAVLLVVPALLVLFAVRPHEHALTTSLLSGVRFVVLLTGLIDAAAALVLAGFTPWDLDAHAWWVVFAISSGLCSALIFAVWWRCGRSVRREVQT